MSARPAPPKGAAHPGSAPRRPVPPAASTSGKPSTPLSTGTSAMMALPTSQQPATTTTRDGPLRNFTNPPPNSARDMGATPAGPLEGPAKVNFLLDVANRLEASGNPVEAVKSLETALILRKSFSDAVQPLFSLTLSKQAQQLILKCNALGVERFQANDYPSAEFFLEKALFLTDDNPATNCFAGQEHDRMRLRAATFNNFGCLEKRRDRLHESLTMLQRAVEVEAMVDPDLGASASTNLNLCTVLNKLGQHDQAAVAAERCVRALRVQAQSSGDDKSDQFVQMTISAYYNLGLSHECAGRATDLQKAGDAYSNCLLAGFKLGRLMPGDNPVTGAAEKALARLGVAPPQLAPPASTPRLSIEGTGALTLRELTATGGALTPRGPQPPIGRGVAPGGTALLASTQPRGARVDTAIASHAARMKSRQTRRVEAAKRSEVALQRAQQAHSREKAEKMRKEQEHAAKERAELAKQLYHRMEAGMRADRMRQLNDAATRIQALWRGFLYRDYLRDRVRAAIKIQSVARSRICRNRLRAEATAAATRALAAARRDQETVAAKKIQACARYMLRRMQCVQNWRARVLRRYHCAKRIQVCWRGHRSRTQRFMQAQLERERSTESQRQSLRNHCAVKIQKAYRAFAARRRWREKRNHTIRINAAATKIQALVRGTLTRAWFRHYRVRRREQELNTAANIRQIKKIQRAWRVAVARRVMRRKQLQQRKVRRERQLFVAARRIQCAWRSSVARQRAAVRRQWADKRHDAAERVQRWWRMLCQRKTYIVRRDEARRVRSVKKVQRWWRSELRRIKEREMARYHADGLRKERVRLLRTQAALLAQSYARTRQSSLAVLRLAAGYAKKTAFVRLIQRAGRGSRHRGDMFNLKRIAYLVDERAKQRVRQNKAASIIQRAVRLYQAKDRVANLRLRRAAAIRIQSGVRMLLGKCRLRALQHQKKERSRDAAARKIQRAVRLFFKRRELKRLEEYYTRRRRQKLLEQRRVEASVSIQAHWRGFATRQATLVARQELMQQTVDAIRIQRAFRAHLFRARLEKEFTRRKRWRNRRSTAAVKLQSFWRRVLAMDYAALLRERKFHRTVAAIVIQCAWRCMRAREEKQRRRQIRIDIRTRSAEKHDAWVAACDRINAQLKYIRDAGHRLRVWESRLRAEADRRQRARLAHLHRCATKIQAVYRGHYERCYARGVRREAREKEAALKKERDRRHRAALRIQCAFRSSVARRRVKAIRRAKLEAALADQIHCEERANPRSVVRQLFWTQEASTLTNYAIERRSRSARQDTAAVQVQRMVRGFLARRRCRRLVREQKEAEAAKEIQAQWRTHRDRLAAEKETRERAAAIKIQSVARMYIVRRRFKQSFDTLRAKRRHGALQEERHDGAATAIQAAWRGTLARQRCVLLRHAQQADREDRLRGEAALLIQKNWRRWQAKRRVLIIRCRRDGVEVPPTRRTKQPKPPPKRTGSGGGSAGTHQGAFRRSVAAVPSSNT